MKYLCKVPVGDWSKDGHSQHKDFYVSSNYPVKDMQQAYRDTCKKIGLQLNHSDNYMGIDGADKHDSKDKWRFLLTEYEQSSIDEKAVKILLDNGFDFGRVDGERDENDKMILQEVYFYDEGVFDLFLWFVSFSMPNDFSWEEVVQDAVPIVGWWSDLNHQIGYGVYH